MKILTVRQPHCWFISNAGKRLENRTWWTDYRGPLLIHAAKGMTRQEYEAADDALAFWAPQVKLPTSAELPRGGIVAITELVGCEHSPPLRRRHECRQWETPGGYVFVLGRVAPVPFIECKGMLGLWTPSPSLLRQVTARGLERLFRGVAEAHR